MTTRKRPQPAMSDADEAQIERRHRATDDDIGSIKRRLDDGAARMDGLEKAVKKNTEITEGNGALLTELRDILTSAKAGLRLLGWIGVAAAWVAGLTGAVLAAWKLLLLLKGGGEPPSAK